jgi:hypothetical protein
LVDTGTNCIKQRSIAKGAGKNKNCSTSDAQGSTASYDTRFGADVDFHMAKIDNYANT